MNICKDIGTVLTHSKYYVSMYLSIIILRNISISQVNFYTVDKSACYKLWQVENYPWNRKSNVELLILRSYFYIVHRIL